MTAPRPLLSLSDRQMKFLRDAAASLPVMQRDQFLQRVSAHLFGEPTDAAFLGAVNAALDQLPTSVFLCDSKSESDK